MFVAVPVSIIEPESNNALLNITVLIACNVKPYYTWLSSSGCALLTIRRGDIFQKQMDRYHTDTKLHRIFLCSPPFSHQGTRTTTVQLALYMIWHASSETEFWCAGKIRSGKNNGIVDPCNLACVSRIYSCIPRNANLILLEISPIGRFLRITIFRNIRSMAWQCFQN